MTRADAIIINQRSCETAWGGLGATPLEHAETWEILQIRIQWIWWSFDL